jgi:hypothetical protein
MEANHFFIAFLKDFVNSHFESDDLIESFQNINTTADLINNVNLVSRFFDRLRQHQTVNRNLSCCTVAILIGCYELSSLYNLFNSAGQQSSSVNR